MIVLGRKEFDVAFPVDRTEATAHIASQKEGGRAYQAQDGIVRSGLNPGGVV